MGFKDNMRLEQIYFANLKRNIATLKAWKESEADAKTLDVLNSCIEADEAIILLYKNLGEEWNELTAYIVEEKGRLEALKAELEAFKGEINEKVDDVNNYLVNLIRELEARVEIIEDDLRTMDRVKIYSLDTIDGVRYLRDGERNVTTEEVYEKILRNYIVFVKQSATSAYNLFYVQSYNATNIYFQHYTFVSSSKNITYVRFNFTNDTVTNYSSTTISLGDIATNKTNITALQGKTIGKVYHVTVSSNPVQYGVDTLESGMYNVLTAVPTNKYGAYFVTLPSFNFAQSGRTNVRERKALKDCGAFFFRNTNTGGGFGVHVDSVPTRDINVDVVFYENIDPNDQYFEVFNCF